MVKLISQSKIILPFILYAEAQSRTPRAVKPEAPPSLRSCSSFCDRNTCSADRGSKNSDIFLTYGSGIDTMGRNYDDNYEGPMQLPTGIPFFGNTYNNLYFSTNGLISFGNGISSYTSQSLPLTGSTRTFLSPFWSDFHPGYGNAAWGYRELSSGDLTTASNMVRADYGLSSFSGTEGVVVTWSQVKFYGQSSYSDATNTVQAIIITDTNHSFAIYHYGDIEWATGTASGGDSCTGLGGTPALIGFNDGYGNYYATPNSQTDSIIDIADGSNVNRVGRYIYKLDGEAIVDALDVVEQQAVTVNIENRFQAWIELVNPVNNMVDHGCWCSRFSETNEYEIGSPIDGADSICKQWIAARRCAGKIDGACYNFMNAGTGTDSYQLEGGACSQSSDSCGYANCLIDVHFSTMLNDLDVQSSAINTNPVCSARFITPTTHCCGDAPIVQSYSSSTATCSNGLVGLL